ncbi:MAG: response regulator transcription factor [Candidatus Gracilibacteria bacterium]|nr:response regulator transcription factor [Candidatus Gracilibacteria bacterium]
MYITIIEDEKVLSNNISKKLIKNGFNTRILNSYNDFMNETFIESDLYVVDISLRDGSGFDIIKFLRETKNSISPIIITSGYNDTEKKVYGLEIGADDYLAKPFSAEELIARIRALLRRSYKVTGSSRKIYKDIVLDLKNNEILKNGVKIEMTPREQMLAELFLLNIGILITKEKLINSVWGEHDLLKVSDNNINVTVSNVRKKLGENFNLKTIVNKGYRLEK